MSDNKFEGAPDGAEGKNRFSPIPEDEIDRMLLELSDDTEMMAIQALAKHTLNPEAFSKARGEALRQRFGGLGSIMPQPSSGMMPPGPAIMPSDEEMAIALAAFFRQADQSAPQESPAAPPGLREPLGSQSAKEPSRLGALRRAGAALKKWAIGGPRLGERRSGD